jgi:hypothetical protein
MQWQESKRMLLLLCTLLRKAAAAAACAAPFSGEGGDVGGDFSAHRSSVVPPSLTSEKWRPRSPRRPVISLRDSVSAPRPVHVTLLSFAVT